MILLIPITNRRTMEGGPYFKVINETKFNYKVGLNIAPEGFNDLPGYYVDTGNDYSGKGFCFAPARYIEIFYDDGDYLCQVEFPKEVVDHYDSDRIILGPKYSLSDLATYDRFNLPKPSPIICGGKGYIDILNYHLDHGMGMNEINGVVAGAIFYNNITMLQYLFQYYRMHILDNCIVYACVYNHLDIIIFLVENGIDFHGDNEDALNTAVEHGNLDIVKYLVDNGADIGANNNYILFNSIIYNKFNCFKYLVENGADIHAQNGRALIQSLLYGRYEFFRYLVKNGANIHTNNDEALRISAKYGNLEIVKYLVMNEADVHADNNMALRKGAENGHFDVVKYLVENGANIHAENGDALIVSCGSGYIDIVKYLVENGADIHVQDDLCLKSSSKNGHTDVVKYLVINGANINILDGE